MYDLPSRKDIASCTITKDAVLTKVAPTLVPRTEEEPPQKIRRERSA
jgi:hypothetical protein